jgi:hypothetical protein
MLRATLERLCQNFKKGAKEGNEAKAYRLDSMYRNLFLNDESIFT